MVIWISFIVFKAIMLWDKYFDIAKSFQDKREILNTLLLKHF